MQSNYHGLVRRDVFPFVPRGGTLLDVGGGVGATAAALVREGVVQRAGVVDLVAPADNCDLAFTYAGDLSDGGLLERIGVEQGPFDTILALDVVEHLVDPWTLVARLHRLLRPGGSIVASIPNIRHYSAVAPLVLRGRWDLADAGILDRTHLRFFVRDTAVSLMTSSGLALDRVEGVGGRQVTDLLNKVTFGLMRGFTMPQYVVLVRRID